MEDEGAFVEACAAAPTDRFLRLVYADWLEERGDHRAKYLRLEHEICARHERMEDSEGLEAEYSSLCPSIPTEWIESAGLKCDVVLQSFPTEEKIGVIKGVRLVTGMGLKEVVDLVESAPVVILRGASLLRTLQAKMRIERVEWGWPAPDRPRNPGMATGAVVIISPTGNDTPKSRSG